MRLWNRVKEDVGAPKLKRCLNGAEGEDATVSDC